MDKQHDPSQHLDSTSQDGGTMAGTPKSTANPLSRQKVTYWVVFCIAFAILAPAVSVALGFTLRSKGMQVIEYGDGTEEAYSGRTLLFFVDIVDADTKAGTVILDWYIEEAQNSTCNTSDNIDDCTPVNIFFDMNLLATQGISLKPDDDPIPSSGLPPKPAFVYNARSMKLEPRRSMVPIFRTHLALFQPHSSDSKSSTMFYPFDRYDAEVYLYAQDNVTDAVVGTNIQRADGHIVGLSATIHKQSSKSEPDTYAILSLRRSTPVVIYVIVSTIAMWLITIILVLVMSATVFFHYRTKPEVLLIPVATLFAFTQLRQSLPGAPSGFGNIIDLVGLVPCLVFLSFTTAFSLGVFLFIDPEDDHLKQLRWRDLRDTLINGPKNDGAA